MTNEAIVRNAIITALRNTHAEGYRSAAMEGLIRRLYGLPIDWLPVLETMVREGTVIEKGRCVSSRTFALPNANDYRPSNPTGKALLARKRGIA